MSEKNDKKIRRLYRKEFAHRADEASKLWQAALKPKPRWCPARVWIFFLRAFVRVGKRHGK